MQCANEVEIVDVTLRDGLQSLERAYPTEVKVEIARRLAAAGVKRIELTSFVRPDVVPQLADAEEVVRRAPQYPNCKYRALIANRTGLERAVASGLGEVVALITASETYNKKNQNMSIAENLEAIEAITNLASRENVHVVAAVGMTMFCPYEGEIPTARVIDLVRHLRDAGVGEYYIATSAGLDGPRRVYELSTELRHHFPEMKTGIHLHNTNGMGLANALAAMDAQVQTFEGALCGIGGGIRLPHESGNHGNLAVEDIVNMFEEMGVRTGIDLDQLLDVSRYVSATLGIPSASYAAAGGTKSQARFAAQRSPWRG